MRPLVFQRPAGCLRVWNNWGKPDISSQHIGPLCNVRLAAAPAILTNATRMLVACNPFGLNILSNMDRQSQIEPVTCADPTTTTPAPQANPEAVDLVRSAESR